MWFASTATAIKEFFENLLRTEIRALLTFRYFKIYYEDFSSTIPEVLKKGSAESALIFRNSISSPCSDQ